MIQMHIWERVSRDEKFEKFSKSKKKFFKLVEKDFSWWGKIYKLNMVTVPWSRCIYERGSLEMKNLKNFQSWLILVAGRVRTFGDAFSWSKWSFPFCNRRLCFIRDLPSHCMVCCSFATVLKNGVKWVWGPFHDTDALVRSKLLNTKRIGRGTSDEVL